MYQRFCFILWGIFVLVLLICCLGLVRPTSVQLPPLALEKAFAYLNFEQPVDLQHSPDHTKRLFVVEQKGIIRVFSNDPQVKESQVFLDLTKQVFSGNMEEGMLGLAFHPDFQKNGYFFINYIADNPKRTVVARLTVDANEPNRADLKSQFVIIEVEQPYGNHKGGQLAFGPDGYLYIGLGDGGSGGDPHGHGQNKKTLLGSILRIDVDHISKDKNYSIPQDNPFSGNMQGYRQEIYAYGLRNPWRFSFDKTTRQLWAADVGQDKPYEEIDLIQKGGNYGWNVMEGFHCFKPEEGCSKEGLILPIWEYTKEEGRSVTGGYVYRGEKLSSLKGHYVYADFVSGKVWALKLDAQGHAHNQLIVYNSNLYPSSFGVDEKGELYICSFDGSIYRLILSK